MNQVGEIMQIMTESINNAEQTSQEVKSWDFRSLAGVGRRDVNIAPLFTASPVQTPAKAHQTPSPV